MKTLAEKEAEEGLGAEVEKAYPKRLFLILAVGFALVFVGVLVLVFAAGFSSGGSASAGVVIFIGPFPIVFGSGPDASWLVLIGIVLAVMSLIVFVFMRRKVG